MRSLNPIIPRLLIALVLAALLAAGCSTPTPAPPPAQEQAPTAQEAPAAEEPTVTEAPATEAPTAEEPTAEPVAEPASEPKILKLRLVADIENLDPAFQPTFEDEYASNGIMQPLVGYKPGTWELENVLAESLESI